MASRRILECDICKKECTTCPTLSFKIDRKIDAAGSMEDVYSDIDLCDHCSHAILIDIIYYINKKNNYEEAKYLLELIKKKV